MDLFICQFVFYFLLQYSVFKSTWPHKPTSISLLRATSSKFSCCSRVLSTLSSVMQKQRSRASTASFILANTTNLARYGTQISSRYNWDARPTVSGIWWQSASQNLRRRYRGKRRGEERGKGKKHTKKRKWQIWKSAKWTIWLIWGWFTTA